jgi:hypothetical protein
MVKLRSGPAIAVLVATVASVGCASSVGPSLRPAPSIVIRSPTRDATTTAALTTSGASGTAEPTTTLRPFTADEERLLDALPEDVKNFCIPAPDGASVARLTCFQEDPGEVTAEYALWPSAAAMSAWYDDALERYGITGRDQGSCSDAWPAEKRYPDSGTPVGRVACLESVAGSFVVLWTDTRSLIGGEATVSVDLPESQADLLDWWTVYHGEGG